MSFIINAFNHNGNHQITKNIGSETDEDVQNNNLKVKVQEFRQVCLDEIKVNPSAYDPRDAALLETDGNMALIMILESNDWKVEPALEAIKLHFTYRKENGILDLKITDIPREVHQTGLYMAKGFDKSGHPLFYLRLSISTGPKELHPILMKYFLLGCETVRNSVKATNKKPGIIYDCRQAQIDLAFVKEVAEIYMTKYPSAAEYIAFFGLNIASKVIVQVIKYLWPKYMRKKMIFIDQEALNSLVDQDNLPTYLGGKLEPLSKLEASDCPSLADYAKANQMDDKLYEKLKSHLDKQIDS